MSTEPIFGVAPGVTTHRTAAARPTGSGRRAPSGAGSFGLQHAQPIDDGRCGSGRRGGLCGGAEGGASQRFSAASSGVELKRLRAQLTEAAAEQTASLRRLRLAFSTRVMVRPMGGKDKEHAMQIAATFM